MKNIYKRNTKRLLREIEERDRAPEPEKMQNDFEKTKIVQKWVEGPKNN